MEFVPGIQIFSEVEREGVHSATLSTKLAPIIHDCWHSAWGLRAICNRSHRQIQGENSSVMRKTQESDQLV